MCMFALVLAFADHATWVRNGNDRPKCERGAPRGLVRETRHDVDRSHSEAGHVNPNGGEGTNESVTVCQRSGIQSPVHLVPAQS